MVILFMGLVVLGLILLQNYLYRKFWDKGLSVDMEFSSKEAFEGDTLFLKERLVNKKILPLPWVHVKFQLSNNLIFGQPEDGGQEQRTGFTHQDQGDLFSISMYQSISRKQPFVCGKRGYYRLNNFQITCSNLLHTRRFDKEIKSFSELTVFPKILEDHEDLDVLYKTLDATLLSNSLINPDPFEFKGIREYQPTDPLRDINFKASAVAQQLMVNIHAPTAAKRLQIVLNLEQYRVYPTMELYEQAIRLAATIATHCINQDVKVGFYTNGRNNLVKQSAYVPGGNSTAHLYSILQAMAHINLSLANTSNIAPYLEGLQDEEVVYLIISSYHGEDFVDAIENMKSKGMAYMVVVPTEPDMEVKIAETNTIKIWEAL